MDAICKREVPVYSWQKWQDGYHMNEQQFHVVVDALFLQIEQWLEQANLLDFETEQGILTIFTPEGGQLILSRQAPLQEIWLATPLGAYHFRFEGAWRTKQGEELMNVLKETIQKMANIILDLKTFNQ